MKIGENHTVAVSCNRGVGQCDKRMDAGVEVKYDAKRWVLLVPRGILQTLW